MPKYPKILRSAEYFFDSWLVISMKSPQLCPTKNIRYNDGNNITDFIMLHLNFSFLITCSQFFLGYGIVIRAEHSHDHFPVFLLFI